MRTKRAPDEVLSVRDFRARLREVVKLVSSGRRRYVVITRRGLAVAALIAAPDASEMDAAIRAHTWRRRSRLTNSQRGRANLLALRFRLAAILDAPDRGEVDSVLVERYWQPVALLVPPEKAVREIVASPRQAVVKQLLRTQ